MIRPRARVALAWGLELWLIAALAHPVVYAAPRSAAESPIVQPPLAAMDARESRPRSPAPTHGGGRRTDDPAAVNAPAPAGPTVAGIATWYGADGMIAAAGPALRRALGRDWRGTEVIVAGAGSSVRVRLTDWCACGRRDGQPTVIDLSDDAFRRLAPLSRGVLRATVILGPPATDTE